MHRRHHTGTITEQEYAQSMGLSSPGRLGVGRRGPSALAETTMWNYLASLEQGAPPSPGWPAIVELPLDQLSGDYRRYRAGLEDQGDPPAPGLTPDKVAWMVQDLGAPVTKFRGRARLWAEEAAHPDWRSSEGHSLMEDAYWHPWRYPPGWTGQQRRRRRRRRARRKGILQSIFGAFFKRRRPGRRRRARRTGQGTQS